MAEWKTNDYLPYATETYPLIRNFGGPSAAGFMRKESIKGLIIHITDGHIALPNLKAAWENRRASAHFAIDKDGTLAQYVPMSYRAWAVDGYKIDNEWYSVENVAVNGEELTEEQLRMCAYLLAWLHGEYGVPIKLAQSPNDSGLAYHALFTKSKPCPGKPVINQLPVIIDYTNQLTTDN